ncbi:hypothetical protein C0992_010915 [Termitomyces sp. T32_za158]|nr:hypothetical protein C0992_010915 [Termitomyces sp. T32_za158]
MASAVTDFNAAVNAFPIFFRGTPRQALAIHSSANHLNKVIANTTTDINGIPSKFSDSQAQDLFGYLHHLEPSFLESLSGIATRKPALDLVRDARPLIKQDLATMKERCDDFMDAFISHAPSSVLVQARAMKTGVDSMFKTLLGLYGM